MNQKTKLIFITTFLLLLTVGFAGCKNENEIENESDCRSVEIIAIPDEYSNCILARFVNPNDNVDYFHYGRVDIYFLPSDIKHHKYRVGEILDIHIKKSTREENPFEIPVSYFCEVEQCK